ncbi:MAG: type II toxin-antitoxin system VapC family toxin [Methylococcaceae bacterium]|nr:type II toxin-antitoxin system VapC family toxin [Methylococcaceae bacterium]
MSRYLVDTDICSYAIKYKQPELLVKIRAGLINDELAISVVTKAELLYGLELVPEATTLRKAVLAFLACIPVLEWPLPAAHHYAKLRSIQKLTGNPIGYMDTLIAAHALAENLILITHNTKHYARVEGLQIEDWVIL